MSEAQHSVQHQLAPHSHRFVLSAKTRPPRLGERVYCRSRLLEQIDTFLSQGHLWIGGPPGAGKTVLAADHGRQSDLDVCWYELDLLDIDPIAFFSIFPAAFLHLVESPDSFISLPSPLPEDLVALPVFARKFFRALFALLPGHWLLILDNIQEIPGDSPLLEVLLLCLQELPLDCRAIMLSRTAPPAIFVRMKTSRQLRCLDAEHLRFNRQETAGVMALYDVSRQDQGACIDALLQATSGWAAGLPLLLSRSGGQCRPINQENFDYQELFDYFTGVIFSELSTTEKTILMQAALLPEIRPKLLDHIYPEAQCSRSFETLSRNNFFTYALNQSGTLYQFHPLFREFLRNRAVERLTPDELDQFQRQVVPILRSTGRFEEIVELLLYLKMAQKSLVYIRHLCTAMLEQGRFKTLLRWQEALPQHLVANEPWLLFCFGNATTAFDPESAIAILEQSFRLFRDQGDTTGALLACSSLTNSIINHLSDLSLLDPWLDFLEEQLDPGDFTTDTSFESINIANAIFRALVLRRPAHPLLETWLQIIVTQDRFPPALITHYLWTGRFVEARAALDHIYAQRRPIGSKLQYLAIKAMEVQYYLIMDDPDSCCRVIEESLQIIRDTGIRVWEVHFLILGAGCCLNSGTPDKATKFLQAVEQKIDSARLLERSYYHVVKTLEALLSHKLTRADHHQQSALDMAQTIGMPSYETWCWYSSALVAVFLDDKDRALERFNRVFELAATPGNPWFTCLAHLGIAWMHLREDEPDPCVEHLRLGFTLARWKNYQTFFFFIPEMMEALSVRALEEDIEVVFVQRFIIRRRLTPKQPPVHLDNWPWPLKIYTMGRFAVVCNSSPLDQVALARNKPVKLLQILIALGGRQVSKSRICNILWPDSEGDEQAAALKITLHRLRRLLGIRDAIIQGSGYLAPNPRCCWVDCWRFERLANIALGRNAAKLPDRNRAIGQALEAYRGDFLAHCQDDPWTFEMRSRLHKLEQKLLAIRR